MATSIIGRDADLNSIVIIINIATIEAMFTFVKSESAIFIKSKVRGASPPTSPSLSYLWTILFISSIWALHSSVAALYFELTNISS